MALNGIDEINYSLLNNRKISEKKKKIKSFVLKSYYQMIHTGAKFLIKILIKMV